MTPALVIVIVGAATGIIAMYFAQTDSAKRKQSGETRLLSRRALALIAVALAILVIGFVVGAATGTLLG